MSTETKLMKLKEFKVRLIIGNMLEREPIYFLSTCHLKLIPVNLEPFFTKSLNNLRENTNSEMAKCNIPHYLLRKCLLNAWLQK